MVMTCKNCCSMCGTATSAPTDSCGEGIAAPGARNRNVSQIQGLLSRLGYVIQDPRGFYGPSTAAAVSSYRTFKGLTASQSTDCSTFGSMKADAEECPETDSPYGASRHFVRGTVLAALAGIPIENATVRLFHWEFKSTAPPEIGLPPGSTTVGPVNTDAAGRFELHYDPATVAALGLPGPHLFVKVDSGTGTPVSAPSDVPSDVVYNARPAEVIHVVFDPDKVRRETEFSRLHARASKFLLSYPSAPSNPKDLLKADIEPIAGVTGFSAPRIARYVLAHRHADKLSTVSAEAFYGLMVGGLPLELQRLRSQSRKVIVATLQRAVAQWVIADTSATFEQIADDLTQDRFDGLLALNPSLSMTGRASWDDILDEVEDTGASPAIPGMDPDDRREFLGRVATHRGTEAAFWKSIWSPTEPEPLPWVTDGSPPDSEKEDRLARLRLVVDLARLTSRTLSVIKKLQGLVLSLKELEHWNQTTWETHIVVGDLPTDWMNGEPTQDRIDGYISALRQRLAGRTRASQLTSLNAGESTDVDKVDKLGGAPLISTLQSSWAVSNGFDLVHSDVEDLIANGDLSAFDSDPAVAKPLARAALRPAQRLLRLTPSLALANTLATGGVLSAYQVAEMDRATFQARFAITGAPEEVAKRDAELAAAHSHAVQQTAAAQLTYSHLSADFYRAEPWGTGTSSPDTSSYPGQSLLASSYSFCTCEHCSSIYSPSAYLFDVLSYLRGLPSSGAAAQGEDASEELLARRPEIGELEMSCPNANAAMPYIDLVNEAMQIAVRQNSSLGLVLPDQVDFLQTTVSPAEALMTPQWVDAAVYSDILDNSGGEAPWTRMLDVDEEEARQRLDQLRHPRSTVMEAFRDRKTAATPTVETIAREVVGLSPNGWGQVGDNATSPTTSAVHTWWNDDGTDKPDLRPGGSGNVGWEQVITWLPNLLEATERTIQEVHEALETPYVDGGLGLEIVFSLGADTCDLAQGWVSNVDEAAMGRLKQLLRVAAATGIRPWLVGEAQDLLSSGSTLTSDFLEALGDTLVIAERLGIDFEEALALTGSRVPTVPVPTYGLDDAPSLYERRISGAPGASSVLALDSSTWDELVTMTADISADVAALAGPLGTTVEEVNRLVCDGGVLGETGPFERNLANVCTLFRWCALTQHVAMEPSALWRFSKSLDIDPFDYASQSAAASLRSFLHQLDAVRASGMQPTTLDWLLRHEPVAALELDPSEDAAIAFWVRLQAQAQVGLSQHQPLVPDGDDEAAGILQAALQRLRPAESQDFANHMVVHVLGQEQVSGNVLGFKGDTYTQGEQTGLFQDVLIGSPLAPHHLPLFTEDGTSVDADLVTARIAPSGAPLFNRVTGILAEYERRSALLETVVSVLSEEVGLGQHSVLAVVDLLPWDSTWDSLRSWLLSGGYDDDTTPTDTFVGKPLLNPDGEWTGGDDLLDVYRLLAKLGRLCSDLALSDRAFELCFDLPDKAHWNPATAWTPPLPVLAELPVVDTDPPTPYAAWRVLATIVNVARTTGAEPEDLLSQVLWGKGPGLAALTGWSKDTIESLTASSGLDLGDVDPPDSTAGSHPLLDDGALPQELIGLEQLALTTGVLTDLACDVATARSLALGEAGLAEANALLQRSLSAKMGDSFAEFERSAQDRLRVVRRDALAEWLRGALGYEDDSELSSYLLMDVSMDPCMLTTRTRHALSVAQTWVQHLLLEAPDPAVGDGLEVDISDGKALQWQQWMKWYRVWEANRKVFIHPENWLEPELRTDSTPLFATLRQRLMQAELTDATAEQAFRGYLEAMLELASLEVVGLYQDEQEAWDGGTTDVLYVVARTASSPHKYFWRTRTGGEVWGPWQAIETNLQSEHILPVVYQRSLYLFWPTWSVERPLAESEDAAVPPVTLKAALSWISLRDGQWTASRTSNLIAPIMKVPAAVIDSMDGDGSGHARAYRLHATPVGDDLEIHVEWVLQSAAGPRGYSPDDPPATTQAGAGTFVLYRGAFIFDGRRDAVVSWQRRPVLFAKPLLPAGAYNDAQQIVGPAEVLSTTEYGAHYAGLSLPSSALPTRTVAVPDEYQDLIGQPGATLPFLGEVEDNWRITPCHQAWAFASPLPFAFSDGRRGYLLDPRVHWPSAETDNAGPGKQSLDSDWMGPSTLLCPVDEAQVAAVEQFFPLESGDTQAGDYFDPLTGGWLFDDYVEGDPSESTDTAGGGAMVLGETSSIDDLKGLLQYLAESGAGLFRAAATHHPYVATWLGSLRAEGLDGFFTLANQQLATAGSFEATYSPEGVASPYPDDAVDFAPGGFWSEYNWELFFHAPMLIADRLMRAGEHRDAQRWLRFVFDPTIRTGGTAPQRFWRFGLLAAASDDTPLTRLLALSAVDPDSLDEEQQPELDLLQAQIAEWVQHPFEPHRIARFRTVAYKRAAVMKYVDNLIHWGDQLFSRDTLESTNEATGLYLAAAQILGDRPLEVPANVQPQPPTWTGTSMSSADGFSIPVVDMENVVPPAVFAATGGSATGPMPPALGLAFCVPFNRRLLSFWDTVADRLFKLRTCRNLQGVIRQLPIFEPPIDPGMLVAARAAGMSIESVLQAGGQGGRPVHRFAVVLERAKEFARDVQGLGGALLSALEKQDGEAMSRLRQSHELRMLDLVKDVRKEQVNEAQQALLGVEKSKEAAEARQAHYVKLLSDREEDQELALSEKERTQLGLIVAAGVLESVAGGVSAVGSVLGVLPEFEASFPPAVQWGGRELNNLMTGIASAIRAAGNVVSTEGQVTGLKGGYERRQEDWQFQRDQAVLQIDGLDKQRLAAQIREALARLELRNHEEQVRQSQEIADFVTRKFSGQALYEWMGGQLMALYSQTFRLALDLARRAERAYRFELYGANTFPSDDPAYIAGDEWAPGRKGLLAGEQVLLELRRLEVAWMDRRVREYEISRTFSLAEVAPLVLLELRRTGSCEVFLAEALFDRDYPGHYFRRIKSVSITVPADEGPPRGVQCTLRLLNDRIRLDTTLDSTSNYLENNDSPPNALAYPDDRFTYRWDASQSIVTSHGRNDAGMFDPSHSDPRYLPFEGAGAISTWRIEVPAEQNSFDPQTLTDVQLHVRYTARDGGSAFRQEAITDTLGAKLGAAFPEEYRWRALSARGDFPTAWKAFAEPAQDADEQVLEFELGEEHSPRWLKNSSGTVSIEAMHLFLVLKSTTEVPDTEQALPVDAWGPASSGSPPLTEVGDASSAADYEVASSAYWHSSSSPTIEEPCFKQAAAVGGVRQAATLQIDASGSTTDGFGAWRLTWDQTLLGAAPAEIQVTNSASKLRLDMEQIVDFVFLLHYSVS
jgi:peptidoglycan hydrolase-like protein with peptidoglycan-binding domain